MNTVNNPSITFCLTFHRAYAKLRLLLDEELGTYHGIDFDDFALLHLLARADDTPTKLEILAADYHASRSAVLRRLRPLEKVGLVFYHGSSTDRSIAPRQPGLWLLKTANDRVGRVCTKLAHTGNVERLTEALLKSELVGS